MVSDEWIREQAAGQVNTELYGGVLNQPAESVGGGYLSLLLWRLARNALYRLVGLFVPSWKRALRLVLLRDAYADKGTMNMPLYSDPRFEANIRALEREIRRVRSGGEHRPVELPHDFPPGSQHSVRIESE